MLGHGGAAGREGKHGSCMVGTALVLAPVLLAWFLRCLELCLSGCQLSCLIFHSLWGEFIMGKNVVLLLLTHTYNLTWYSAVSVEQNPL